MKLLRLNRKIRTGLCLAFLAATITGAKFAFVIILLLYFFTFLVSVVVLESEYLRVYDSLMESGDKINDERRDEQVRGDTTPSDSTSGGPDAKESVRKKEGS